MKYHTNWSKYKKQQNFILLKYLLTTFMSLSFFSICTRIALVRTNNEWFVALSLCNPKYLKYLKTNGRRLSDILRYQDVIKWKHFRVTGPLFWEFTRHRVKYRDTGDLIRRCAHDNVTVMKANWTIMTQMEFGWTCRPQNTPCLAFKASSCEYFGKNNCQVPRVLQYIIKCKTVQ